MNGSKIIFFELKNFNIQFLDSYKLIPIKLSKIPKALLNNDHDYDLVKKEFPYKYLTAENLAKRVCKKWPSKDYFILDRKSPSELEEFNKWYDDIKDTPFNLKKEVTEYIFNDVLILYLGLLSFQELVLSVTKCDHLKNGCDPLQNCCTISALALKVFRQMDLTEIREVQFEKGDSTLHGRAIVRGNKMEVVNGSASALSKKELAEYKITSYKLVKSSLAILPTEHCDHSKRNNYSKEAMGYILHYEKMLQKLYSPESITAHHALAGGEACISLNNEGISHCYLDGLFIIKTNTGIIKHGVMFQGCW